MDPDQQRRTLHPPTSVVQSLRRREAGHPIARTMSALQMTRLNRCLHQVKDWLDRWDIHSAQNSPRHGSLTTPPPLHRAMFNKALKLLKVLLVVPSDMTIFDLIDEETADRFQFVNTPADPLQVTSSANSSVIVRWDMPAGVIPPPPVHDIVIRAREYATLFRDDFVQLLQNIDRIGDYLGTTRLIPAGHGEDVEPASSIECFYYRLALQRHIYISIETTACQVPQPGLSLNGFDASFHISAIRTRDEPMHVQPRPPRSSTSTAASIIDSLEQRLSKLELDATKSSLSARLAMENAPESSDSTKKEPVEPTRTLYRSVFARYKQFMSPEDYRQVQLFCTNSNYLFRAIAREGDNMSLNLWRIWHVVHPLTFTKMAQLNMNIAYDLSSFLQYSNNTLNQRNIYVPRAFRVPYAYRYPYTFTDPRVRSDGTLLDQNDIQNYTYYIVHPMLDEKFIKVGLCIWTAERASNWLLRLDIVDTRGIENYNPATVEWLN